MQTKQPELHTDCDQAQQEITRLREALAALILTIDAGGATLGGYARCTGSPANEWGLTCG